MEQLPDELVLAIFAYLEPAHVAVLQQTCRRLLHLGRDASLWRRLCFESSREETKRRRAQLLSREHTLSALRRALTTHPAGWRAVVDTDDEGEAPSTPVQSDGARESQPRTLAPREPSQKTLLAQWDPAGPHEQIDWRSEYQHRHGPLSVGWLEKPRDGTGYSQVQREALGLAAFYEHGVATRALSPLDDGSLCLWDLQSSSTTRKDRLGAIASRTAPNFFRVPNSPIEEPGALDTVTVDSLQQHAYVGMGDTLYQIDLNTLQVASQRSYGTTITALSPAANSSIPLTVGTLHALYQYDAREPSPSTRSTVEHIAGANPRAAAGLPQPGPLALLHPPDSHSIWVAGRFTSLLHYDRRKWPRLASSHFSGARLAALGYLPSSPSTLPSHSSEGTLLAAGGYKGKGSLELYSLADPEVAYTNRHAAARSRILSAVPHAARLLVSDGDGALRWLERDANSSVRSTSLALLEADGASFVYEEQRWARGRRQLQKRKNPSSKPQEANREDADHDSGYVSSSSASVASAASAATVTTTTTTTSSPAYRRARDASARERREQAEDVVQRLVPTALPAEIRYDAQEDLSTTVPGNGGVLLQTGEGRVGLLGFAGGDPLATGHGGGAARAKNGSQQKSSGGSDDEDEDEAAWLERHDDEAEGESYDAAVRRALATAERDLHWLRGLGQ